MFTVINYSNRSERPITASSRTQIVLLGTGTPNAEPDRAGSATAIVVDDRPYLFDLGPGVIRRVQAALELGIAGLALPKLDLAFVTHLHTDHTLGYADFIFTPWVLDRSAPPRVFGPPGLQAMTDHLLAAYAADIHERRTGLEPGNATGYQVTVQEIAAGPVYADERIEVHAFPVRHGAWPAFGYRCVTPDRTIVISGDTAPTPDLAEHYAGCDILVHEVYPPAALPTRPPAWQRYHAAVHTSTIELAALVNAVRPGLLVLVHQLRWGVGEADLLAEITARYDGEVIAGRDLMVIE